MLIIILIISTTSAYQLTFNSCSICNYQQCNVNISSNVTNIINYIENNIVCICNNMTCGRYCENSYYSKSDIIDCSRKFFCRIMSPIYSMFILITSSFAGIFGILLIFALRDYYDFITHKKDEYQVVNLKHINDVHEDEDGKHNILDFDTEQKNNDAKQFIKATLFPFLFFVIGLTLTFIIRIAEANNMNDAIHCL